MIFLLDGTESVLREVLPFVPALVGLGGGILATALFFRSRIYLPRHQRWQIKGLDLLVAGKPIQAERYYRAAMDLGDKVPEPDRVCLMVCLGESLIDQRRYEEAHQILAEALDLGDPIGSGQDNMCEVLLSQRAAPEKAIEMADEAMQLWACSEQIQLFGVRWAAVSREIHEAKSWAHKARALLILGQRTGAQQAVGSRLENHGNMQI